MTSTQAATALLEALLAEGKESTYATVLETLVSEGIIEDNGIAADAVAFVKFHAGQDVTANGWGDNLFLEHAFSDYVVILDAANRLTGEIRENDYDVVAIAIYRNAAGDMYAVDCDNDGESEGLGEGDVCDCDYGYARVL